jgi:hypothetical protein
LSAKNETEAEAPQAAVAVAAPAGPAPTAAPAIASDDIAVIAAAVYAMLDTHRIVHIEDTNRGVIWTAEGRWMHQTSHTPH